MPTPQSGSLAFPPSESRTVFVNDGVSYRTEGTARVISVHGVVFAHYDTSDRAAEVYAMVTLVDAGYADQNDVARAFDCSTRSLRRYHTHYHALTNVLKMVAFQAEGALVELLEPHYARNDDEGRTLIQTALRSAASIEPTAGELRVTLAPLSSPHRSQAIRALCDDLNMTNTFFPGTKQRLRFAVAEAPVR